MTTASTTTPTMPPAPRQFALVLDPDDPDYDEFVTAVRPADPVLWWGAAFGDRVVLYRDGTTGLLDTARHCDVDSALDRWSSLYPVRLQWL